MLEIAIVIMVITFGMAMFYMIKGCKEDSSVNNNDDDEVIIDKVNEPSIYNIDIESEEDLELLANTLETVTEEIIEEVNEFKEHCVDGTIEKLNTVDRSLPKIINEVIEIENTVEPEIEYTDRRYHIIDTELSYVIEGDSERVNMNHIIKGVFTTNEDAGKDYNTMNVHLIIINKTTNEEVVNVIQSYYNVTEPNSDYHFGFNEVTGYNEDDYTFKCSITGYYDHHEHENNIAFKANLRK